MFEDTRLLFAELSEGFDKDFLIEQGQLIISALPFDLGVVAVYGAVLIAGASFLWLLYIFLTEPRYSTRQFLSPAEKSIYKLLQNIAASHYVFPNVYANSVIHTDCLSARRRSLAIDQTSVLKFSFVITDTDFNIVGLLDLGRPKKRYPKAVKRGKRLKKQIANDMGIPFKELDARLPVESLQLEEWYSNLSKTESKSSEHDILE